MKRKLVILLSVTMLLFSGCGGKDAASVEVPSNTPPEAASTETEALTGNAVQTETETQAETETQTEAVEKNGEVMVLFTSDVHCGIEDGFGYDGLWQIRDTLENQGYTTILVDDGDAFQGGTVGTLTKGEAIVEIMNAVGYDVVIPGNHDFDYGMDQFMKLAGMADFPYICCNFRKEGKCVLPAYIIREACGMKIGFVGVTTPKTISTSTPAYFQNDRGEYIYDFMEDDTGEMVYNAVQEAADAVRKEGADVVYLIAHLGNDETVSPWTYADVISHTSGIDVVLDGHSHDTDQVIMKNKDGIDVKRVAVGTKLNCIGYSHVTRDGGVVETSAWSWPNKDSIHKLFDMHNEVSDKFDKILAEVDKEMNVTIARTDEELTINDPVEKDNNDEPVRMVRRAETNLGDLCADAYRIRLGADIGLINSGAIRTGIEKGDITNGEILDVHPFGNTTCVVEATGQQILDALEWGVRTVPDENGAFLQVSGLSYEVDVSIPSGCLLNDDGMCTGIKGSRRVKNVLVGDVPIDPKKKYTVGSIDYLLTGHGDGQTAFDDSVLLDVNGSIDSQLLIDYITENLGGEVGDEYADPYGQGRITITGE